MSRDKMEYAMYKNPESNRKKDVYYEDLNTEEYEAKYRNNLTCINGCEARVKFTQRKNNIKFFSTWNGEGNKHNEECPFNVNYKGKIGREKLKAYYEKRPINDEDIKNTLLSKIRGLKRRYNGEDSRKVNVGSKEVEKNGEKDVPVNYDDELESNELNAKSRREHNITSIDAKFLSTIYIGTRKCVYGIGNNVQIDNKNGDDFGYINLENRGYSVAVYFPKAFYSQENGITLEDFKRFFKILKVEINEKPERKAVIVCYGEIKRKDKKGVNISIINEAHIFINDMSVREILSEGNLKDIDYDIV